MWTVGRLKMRSPDGGRRCSTHLPARTGFLVWQDRRYRIAYQLGQLLTDNTVPGSGHAVYGVYLVGGVLLCVGQARDARRRLRDLPVGESHHHATTVPPGTWERVIVVQWPRLLDPEHRGAGCRMRRV